MEGEKVKERDESKILSSTKTQLRNMPKRWVKYE